MSHQWVLLSLLFFTILSPPPTFSSPTKISYSSHCSSIIPPSIPSGHFLDSFASFPLSNGYFSGRDKILVPDSDSSSHNVSYDSSFYFSPRYLQRTRTPGVFKVEGTLSFQGSGAHLVPSFGTKSRRKSRYRTPAPDYERKFVNFELSGFWSESTGKLCTVGKSSSTSHREVESLDTKDSLDYFEPILILAYAQSNYSYTQISPAMDMCSHVRVPKGSLGIETSGFCSYLQNFISGRLRLDYGYDCSGGSCDPFPSSLC